MPCVICKADTKKGFTYCEPCMKKDLEERNAGFNEISYDNHFKQKDMEKHLPLNNSIFDSTHVPAMSYSRTIDVQPKLNSHNSTNHKKNKIHPIEISNDIDYGSKSKNLESLLMKNDSHKINDSKKQVILDEMKMIHQKLQNMEMLLKDTFVSIFILVSRDSDNMVHLHGIYSNQEKGLSSYNKLVHDADKYSKIIKLDKIILYKTFIDNLDDNFDTALFDDCDMEVIVKKEYNITDLR